MLHFELPCLVIADYAICITFCKSTDKAIENYCTKTWGEMNLRRDWHKFWGAFPLQASSDSKEVTMENSTSDSLAGLNGQMLKLCQGTDFSKTSLLWGKTLIDNTTGIRVIPKKERVRNTIVFTELHIHPNVYNPWLLEPPASFQKNIQNISAWR